MIPLPLIALALIALALVGIIWLRPQIGRERTGKVLIFLALFVLPILVIALGGHEHVEHSKSTGFCLSCHTMTPYGKSLWIQDPEALPAAHFQNMRIPRDKACYTCHTTYTMYGDLHDKLRGLRHLYVQYLGTIPEKIQLYEPYNNRECLHCHSGARSFEENEVHEYIEGSCMDCHAMTHAIDELESLELWNPVNP